MEEAPQIRIIPQEDHHPEMVDPQMKEAPLEEEGLLETLEVWEDIPIEEKEVPRDLGVSWDLKDIQAPEVMMADKACWDHQDHLDPKD